MGQFLSCFKAYDVRGKVPAELNPEIAYAIGRAYAQQTGAKRVCIGFDIRMSGPELTLALTKGLNEEGCNVVDLGLVGTEMVYFATAYYGYDGGIMVTASHNPPEYNGMKMVRQESRPISGDSGLYDIEERAHRILNSATISGPGGGNVVSKDCYADFVQHLLKIVPPREIKPYKVLACPGNGAAGVAMEALMPHLPIDVTKMLFEPDGRFPNGVPNPILEESRAPVEAELRKGGYDLGIAWDGDYDRCFLLDENGVFIEGYYIVGLLAQAILEKNPGATIIYDPRLTWNTLEIVEKAGGNAVICKSGHAFIKEKMRAENAVYGGEMSAHHYFRDHWYCDSGMIPMLLVLQLMSSTGKSLGELVRSMMEKYPCSGEINVEVEDVPATLAQVEAVFSGGKIDHMDGLSVEFPEWRFNLRGSNTEPVIRLNVESRGDAGLMKAKTDEILALIKRA
ncbi:phosphomannomutase CpsG [Kamptonema cortianum]|nr:phosphomannomutase CpsG [Geitlerinema splendidum]MDK3160927.1 phosphomannomutase CpsG [Kamptonema cortianum]